MGYYFSYLKGKAFYFKQIKQIHRDFDYLVHILHIQTIIIINIRKYLYPSQNFFFFLNLGRGVVEPGLEPLTRRCIYANITTGLRPWVLSFAELNDIFVHLYLLTISFSYQFLSYCMYMRLKILTLYAAWKKIKIRGFLLLLLTQNFKILKGKTWIRGKSLELGCRHTSHV